MAHLRTQVRAAVVAELTAEVAGVDWSAIYWLPDAPLTAPAGRVIILSERIARFDTGSRERRMRLVVLVRQAINAASDLLGALDTIAVSAEPAVGAALQAVCTSWEMQSTQIAIEAEGETGFAELAMEFEAVVTHPADDPETRN